MQQIPGDGEQPFLDRSVWTEPLFKFAQVSGLVISLYDPKGRRLCGPCFNQSLASRLARAGIWDEGGWGLAHERQLVQGCVRQKEAVQESILGLFGQLALPCSHQGEVALVFVLGWVPQHGADSETLKHLANVLEIPLEEIWQQIRMMAPISGDRLRMHGHMLEIFSDNLLQQLALHKEKHREITGWRILSDSAFALAGATTEHEICQIAHGALRSLLQNAHAVIKLIPARGPLGAAIPHENEDKSFVSMMPRIASVRQHISIPILARHEQFLGQIHITLEYGEDINDYLETLTILAGQLGVALHKARLLSLWDEQRCALEHGRADSVRQYKVKDDFLAAVSHELKLPLTALTGWVLRMQADDVDPARAQDALHTIERSVRHQSRLIEDLLDISQMISGSVHLVREELDARELVEKVLSSIMPTIASRQQTLETMIPEAPLRLHGDGARLHQVFWNLLSNASKFTDDGGCIRVTLDQADSYLRFKVSDSGKGIAAEDIAQLFYCFQPGRLSGAHANRGLGLGLAMVKHLVDMHGGTVLAKSEGEGCGATFTVLLPQASLPSRTSTLNA
ncbi:MAG TPA: HAMP domain-containing sensor histidine kinase [Oligoflexus sp.]|uniref:sensor histidine kinase n=1 Tax=Oligoflexus sp. TaxID=1971216 RepID=UPI002D7EBC0D|nr:HAMP domain-containing sensor histidine kinase [Oligoflexus sp.]HET9235898.1 HAMP domain-containing sensor histidine kinase [Oligoflexus sp.]